MHREACKIIDEDKKEQPAEREKNLDAPHRECTYTGLIRTLNVSMLKEAEMSVQEAALYLLHLSMSEKSRDVVYVNTMWPEQRVRVRKTNTQMDAEELDEYSTDVWKVPIERYEVRPAELHSAGPALDISRSPATGAGYSDLLDNFDGHSKTVISQCPTVQKCVDTLSRDIFQEQMQVTNRGQLRSFRK